MKNHGKSAADHAKLSLNYAPRKSGFNEIELRLMLERATAYHENHEEGRWIIVTTHSARSWEIIVEPSQGEELLIVITAYPVS